MATYSFTNVHASIIGFGGIVSIGNTAGVAEEGITIERDEDKNTMTIGADGTVMHSLHAGKAGTCSVRLLKTAPANMQLQVMYDAQTISSALWGSNVITVTDPIRGDITTLRNVAFKRAPNITYAKDGGTVEWQFSAGKIDMILGPGTP